ncbi:MAG: ABC transporter permease, partial [Promethearchaeota archaeon]
NVGTYEILLTLPVTFRDIIVGKFLAAVMFVAIMLLPTIFYAISATFLGKLDWGPVIGGYIGALLLGAAFCAIGLLASSLTRNQVIAAVIGVVASVSLWLLDILSQVFGRDTEKAISYLTLRGHYFNFMEGIIDTRDLVYYLSVTFIFLFLASRVLESRRWQG